MSLFDKFFGTPMQKQAKRIIKDAKKETARVVGPLGDVAKAVIRAAHTCSQGIKPMLRAADAQGTTEMEMKVFYEFVFFFLHMTNRAAHPRLTAQQIEKLHAYLGETVVPAAVDAFVAHWPENTKALIRTEFFGNLNNAEMEYSTAKSLSSKDQPFSDDSLLGKLARHIAKNIGRPMDATVMMPVISLAIEALKEAKLDQLISHVAKVV